MKKILYLILILAGGGVWAQTITPQVINSAGMHRVASNGLSLTDNVGEPFTTTIGNNPVVTQGFIQPLSFVAPGFTVDVFVTDVTCTKKNDGKISTAITSTAGKYDVKYIWTPTVVCPGQNCSSIDSLEAGTYSLSVVVSYTPMANLVKSDTLKNLKINKASLKVVDENGPCRIKVFSGISANGDGINDFLYIENITEFPNNRLTVYNRWGAQLYDQKNYDNLTKIWPTADDLSKIVPSTYFYILDLGDGSKPIKGWIEVIKN